MTRFTGTLLAAVVTVAAGSRVASAVPEICGNSADDDLNGLTDETCYPTLSTGVCESPLSCGDTGMVSWKTGSLHYALPPDIAPAVPFGPGIGMRRFYTSMYSPGTEPPSVNKTPLGPRWQHTYLTWVRLFTVGVDKKAVHHTSQGRDVLYAKTSEDSNYYYYTPQTGEHVLSFKVGKAEFSNTYIQLLTGETLVYDTNGQLIEIWDNFGPTPKKVLVTWTSSSNGNVSTVTDAHGRRRLLFNYTSGLLTSVEYQTLNGSWTTRHTTTYGFTSGNLTSVTIGGSLAQQLTYTSSYLTQINDGGGNQIVSFAYDAITAGKLDRVTTSRGTAGFEYSPTRTGCSGTDKTLLYFNLGNATSCNVDSDCGTGLMCGGKTGSGATGRCFLAARCLTTSLVNSESVVTNVSPIGPGGGSCSGACTDVMQYVWTAASGNINVTGEQDPLGNYTSITYNSNGLPTQVGYGDTDADPVNGGTNRTTFITYDTTYPGRIAETRRQSDLNTTTCTTSNATGCDVTTYCYSHLGTDCNSACATYDNQLCTVTRSGSTLDASGTVTPFTDTITYHHDSNARILQIDGAMPGIKTVFTFQDGHALPDIDGFLGDVKLYKNVTDYLQIFVSGYDIYGHPTGVKDPNGGLTCDSYDFARGYLTTRRRAMAGQPTCDGSDPLDITTSWARDSALRLTQVTRPDTSCVFYIYDTSGRLSQIKRRDDCNALSAGDYQQFVYTPDSQIGEIDTYNASAVLTAKQPYTYFASRRLQKIVNPANTSKFTGMVYDAAGKVTEIDGGSDGSSNLSKTVYHFDGVTGRDNRVTSEERFKDVTSSDTWSLLYAWQGGQSQVTDGDNKATQSVRDDRGRVVKLVSPDMAGPTVRVYDAAGRLSTMIEVQGGGANQQTHTFTYDGLNRQLTADYHGYMFGPNCPQNGFPHPEIRRTYDALPVGANCPIANGCNNLTGRLAHVAVILMCSSAFVDGTLDQETFYSYDAAGRVVAEYIRDDSNRAADHYYTWRKNGTLETVTTPSSAVLGWTFDSTGSNSDKDLITGIFRTSVTTPIIENVTWYPFGPLKYYLQENTSSSIKENTTISRNLAYRITDLTVATTPGNNIQKCTITEDAKGRVTQRDYWPNTLGMVDSSFFYDQQDRLICETAGVFSSCQASANKNKHDLSPPFKNAGDWKHLLRPVRNTNNPVGYIHDINTSGSTYGTSHQITDINQSDGNPTFGHTAYAYDARGYRSYDDNTTTLTRDRRDYTYDGRRNLVNVRGQYFKDAAWHYYDVTSAFDAKNRRVFKAFLDETTQQQAHWFFYYDPLDRLTEVRYTPDISQSGTYSLFQLFWLGDRLVFYWQTDYPSVTTSKRYVNTDETNRPVDMICWGTGNCGHVWQIDPSGWGYDKNVLGPTVYQPILFAGQYVDPETVAWQNNATNVHRPGVAVNGFRTYDAFTGSYLQVDALAHETWSSYIYADSDPVNKSDPSGRSFNLGLSIEFAGFRFGVIGYDSADGAWFGPASCADVAEFEEDPMQCGFGGTGSSAPACLPQKAGCASNQYYDCVLCRGRGAYSDACLPHCRSEALARCAGVKAGDHGAYLVCVKNQYIDCTFNTQIATRTGWVHCANVCWCEEYTPMPLCITSLSGADDFCLLDWSQLRPTGAPSQPNSGSHIPFGTSNGLAPQ